MTNVGWKFPPTDGGMESGINDAGIVTFDGAPLSSLAREVIQNSLDARDNFSAPVHITFELGEVETKEVGGSELADHLDSCIASWSKDPKALLALRDARAMLESDTMTLLGVVDTNTTGLSGETWRHLVKVNGSSFKRSESAGGSFGVGKAAPFTVSPLRTVFYWSAFNQDEVTIEKFQGKVVLVSHDFDFGRGDESTQSTGFFGFRDQCQELRGDLIPGVFRNTDNGEPVQGTAVWIAGFKPDQHGESWQRAVARSIVESFFYAIQAGDLEVLLEPEEDSENEALWEIESKTLAAHFDLLTDAPSTEDEDDAIDRSHLYWRLISSGPPTATMDPPDKDLGAVKLWIGTQEDFPGQDLPSRVALIRGTGMVVTDQQERHRFRRLSDYVAVCVIDDEQANKLLRDMENPSHDQFQFERLREEERDRGRRALDRLTGFLRTQLRIHAAPPAIDVTAVVDELADYLFDDHAGPLDGPVSTTGAEAAFGEVGAVKKKPPRIRVQPQTTLSEEESVEDGESGEGTDLGGSGGGGNGGGGGGGGGGSGFGDSQGGYGTKGGSKGRQMLELGDVRFLHDPSNPLSSRITFTAPESATVDLTINEAGDGSAIPRPDLKVFDDHGESVVLSDCKLTKGTRYSWVIKGERPLADAAWQIAAVEEAAK